MALLDLLRRYGTDAEVPVQAVTVDHGLRAEAKDEIALVARYCTQHQVPHHVLHWSWDSTGNLQDAARAARYQLMADWAQGAGVDTVVLAHSQDDVAETFLMRLSRAAGVDGLAAMQAVFTRHGLRWVRPVLDVPRATLRAHLRAQGIGWAEDPSNADPRFDRVKARQALAALEPLGIDAATVATSATHLAATRDALRQITEKEAARHVCLDRGDVLMCGPDGLDRQIRRRLFVAALRFVSGAGYAPRESAVAQGMDALASGRAATLAGCYCSVTRQDGRITWRISREFNAVKDVVCSTKEPWDGRWQLSGPPDDQLEIAALGEAVTDTPWRDSGLPRTSLMASPAVWSKGILIAAPLAGLGPDWTAQLVPGRDDFAASLIRR
jgi:tRNA(Ile)-lysidine synthase